MKKVEIFFGNKQSAIPPVTEHCKPDIVGEPFKTMMATHGLDTVIFPYQVHGTAGLIITEKNKESMQPFVHAADWVITNLPNVGLGILTADCVPLLVYDPVAQVVGAIHAGWRGAADGVVLRALEGMQNVFGTRPSDVQISIGPHARTCCYRVDQQFYDIVMQKQFGTNSWQRNKDQIFFDLYQCCVEQLKKTGVRTDAITDTGFCTVCTPAYSSYRREKNAALRNISLISLC